MTKKDNQDTPVEVIKLRDEKGNVYSDLLTLYNVYVPAVKNSDEIDENLKLFSAFFSINSEEEMANFIDLYSATDLGEKLIASYSKAILRGDLQTIREREYFDMKITEQDFIEAKIESEEKGRAEERAKARSNVLEKIKTLISKGFDTEILVETFHVTGEERQIFAI